MNDKYKDLASGFSKVDTDVFFNKHDLNTLSNETDIIVLTKHEQSLVNNIFNQLKLISPETHEGMSSRMEDLTRFANTITHFPSLYERQQIINEERSTDTLIDSLLKYRNGDRMLHLPAKAVLGKSFLVVKFHIFSAMTRVATNCNFKSQDIRDLRQATFTILFTLMAEDVYLTLLEDNSINKDIRKRIAESLISLWEHRIDKTVTDIAPVLDAVWTTRHKLAPTFGTMIGTSELLLMSFGLDENWRIFLMEKIGEQDVAQAMEEFLFGLSYEQITNIKAELRNQGLSAIGREEVCEFCGDDSPIDISLDPRNLYLTYTVRRENVRARKRLKLEGPKKTLEDHFMKFILEKEQENQQHGS